MLRGKGSTWLNSPGAVHKAVMKSKQSQEKMELCLCDSDFITHL